MVFTGHWEVPISIIFKKKLFVCESTPSRKFEHAKNG